MVLLSGLTALASCAVAVRAAFSGAGRRGLVPRQASSLDHNPQQSIVRHAMQSSLQRTADLCAARLNGMSIPCSSMASV